MKDEKKHLYRLDPAKVQQKLYDSYPSNSVTKKKILVDIKKKETDRLNRQLSAFPVTFSKTLLEKAVEDVKMDALTFFGWFFLLSAFILGAITFAQTSFEVLLVYIIIIGCAIKTVSWLFKMIKQMVITRSLAKAVKNLIAKIEEIKKKIQK